MSSDTRSILAGILLVLSAAAGSAPARGQSTADPGAEPWTIATLLRSQSAMHRELAARDVAKLLYQASVGVGHMLADTASVRHRLAEEIAGLDTPSAGEPLLERIAPDGGMLRVNLRPWKALNLPPEALVQALFSTAAETVPDTALFYQWWAEYDSLLRSDPDGPVPSDIQEWRDRIVRGAIGPAHHSPLYERVNRPAYRVVRRSVILRMLHRLGSP